MDVGLLFRGLHGGPKKSSNTPGPNHREPRPERRGRAHTALCVLALWVLFAAGCRGGPVGNIQARLDLKEGNQSYLRGEFKEAIRHYEAALRHAPRNALAALYRAYSHVNLFRLSADPEERKQLGSEAVKSFVHFLEIEEDGGDTVPSRNRIEQYILTLYLDANESEKAVAFLEDRLEKDPDDISALQMLSNIKSDLGDIPGALALHRRRVELNPESPEAHHALAVFAWSVAFNSRLPDSLATESLVDEGIQEARKAMELRRDYVEAITYANLLYREKLKRTEDPLARQRYESTADSLRNRAMELQSPPTS